MTRRSARRTPSAVASDPFAELYDPSAPRMSDPVVRYRALYVYEIAPIDLGWRLLLSVDAMREILAKEESEFLHGVEGYFSTAFWATWKQAQQVARQRGWDGTFRENPRVFFLPDPDPSEFACGFVWKQDNNGTTYVVSPKPLPWLERANP